ncbi:hypothetical protein U1Q18_000100, partial [Sarracenia purpurea var. burkii]
MLSPLDRRPEGDADDGIKADTSPSIGEGKSRDIGAGEGAVGTETTSEYKASGGSVYSVSGGEDAQAESEADEEEDEEVSNTGSKGEEETDANPESEEDLVLEERDIKDEEVDHCDLSGGKGEFLEDAQTASVTLEDDIEGASRSLVSTK